MAGVIKNKMLIIWGATGEISGYLLYIMRGSSPDHIYICVRATEQATECLPSEQEVSSLISSTL